MIRSRIKIVVGGFVLSSFLFSGCGKLPGKPDPDEQWKRPETITDFHKLYSQNCAACHAIQAGQMAAALPLNDPLYLAFAGEKAIRNAITNGVPGTTMPAFGPDRGGYLTEEQIDSLATGVMQSGVNNWSPSTPLPPYSAPLGNAATGHAAFAVFCASCHGPDGKGTGKLGSIVDPNYLTLVSNQGLRTLIVTGRRDLKHPDFTHDLSDRAMTGQEIADVVAWLAAQRPVPTSLIR